MDVSKTHPVVWTFCGIFTLHHLQRFVSFGNAEDGNDPYGSIRHVIAVTIPRLVGIGLVDDHPSDNYGFRLLQHALAGGAISLLAFPGFPCRCCIGFPTKSLWYGKPDSLELASIRLTVCRL